MKLVYSQAPELSFWWVDDYADFDSHQKPQVRDALKAFFRWHRSSQLPDYSALLTKLEASVSGPVTGPQVCGWYADAVVKTEQAAERALPAMVSIAKTMTPEQIDHVAKRFEKKNRTWVEDHLQENPADRVKAAMKRARDRAELLYGSIDNAQRDRLAQGLAQSPFDPRIALAERRARQAEVIQALQKVSAPGVGNDEATATLRTLVQRSLHSPNEAYRTYRDKQMAHDCAMAADLHNSTNASQRAAASKRLAGWQEDIRSLGAATAP